LEIFSESFHEREVKVFLRLIEGKIMLCENLSVFVFGLLTVQILLGQSLMGEIGAPGRQDFGLNAFYPVLL
jgi:hypothetical protein